MTQPSSRRFVMEDRLQTDLAAFQASVDADQTAFEGTVNAKIDGLSGQNYLINGAFDVWQRGVGPFLVNAYCADRWKIDARSNMSVGQYTQPTDYFTSGNLTEGKYALEIYSANTTNSIQISQYFESGYVNALRGYNVVLSFSMQCRDSTAPLVTASIGVSEFPDSSTAAFSIIATATNEAQSSWQRYELSTTIPYDLTNQGVCVRFNLDNIALDEHVQITNVKLERGTVATPFTRAGGNLAGERVACQRYYQRITGSATAGAVAHGGAGSTTSASIIIPLKVSMRTAPTAIDYPTPVATYFASYNWAGAGGSTASAIALSGVSNTEVAMVSATITGATANTAMYLRFAGATTYLGFTAEL